MSERERFLQWMKDKGLDTKTVAEATGDTYSTVHMISKGDRPVSDAFKWRFRCAFGDQEASLVFDVTPEHVLEPP